MLSFTPLEEAKEVGAPILAYGNFLQNVIDFLIVAVVIFLIVRTINRMKKKEEAAPAAPPKPSEEIQLLREIRDNLKSSG